MEVTPEVKTKVDGLIANEATQFTEKDREWLQVLHEDQLDLMRPVENIENNGPEDEEDEDTDAEEMSPETNEAQDNEVQVAMRLLQASRERMTANVLKAGGDAYNAEELADMAYADLEKLDRLASKARKADFTANAPAPQPSGGKVEPMPLPNGWAKAQ